MTVEVVTSCDALAGRLATVRDGGGTGGFVPTMGYLHEGHGSLVDASVAATDILGAVSHPVPVGRGVPCTSRARLWTRYTNRWRRAPMRCCSTT